MSEQNLIEEAAYSKGFAMGKYTQDIPLSASIIQLLENSTELMNLFIDEYRKGFKFGMLQTLRA